MSDKFQPTLAAKVRKNKGIDIFKKDMATVTWPKFGSPKLDGIRTWNPYGDAMLSRTMKRIPNVNFQRYFGHEGFMGIDGEGIHGLPYQPLDDQITVMQRAESGMMTQQGPDDVDLYAFDYYDEGVDPYEKRLQIMHDRWGKDPRVVIVQQELIYSWEEAYEAYQRYRNLNYEGFMLRSPTALYMTKRSTLRENILVKMKASDDCEAVVVGFEELHSNENEQRLDERGYSKRSSHKENQVPMNMLGAFVCRNEMKWPGRTFKIGTGIGLTHALRREIWANQSEFLGKIVNFTYDEMRSFEKPSIPSWRGFRTDLGANAYELGLLPSGMEIGEASEITY